MVLDVSLLNTQHYKVRLKVKVEQSRKVVAPSLQLGVVAIEKGDLGSPSTAIANNSNNNNIWPLHMDVPVLANQ